jgi:hypothetical protein
MTLYFFFIPDSVFNMSSEKILKKIDIFISSPSDIEDERKIVIKVIGLLNNMSHIKDLYVLKPLAYEKIVPPIVGTAPQSTVDRYMMEASKADIFICILSQRMGTPVIHEETKEEFESGTEYEFKDAYRSNQKRGKPYMLLYRGMKHDTPNADSEQLRKVQNFFKLFSGDYPEYKGLYKKYNRIEEFEQLIFKNIDSVISDLLIKPDTALEKHPESTTEHIRCDFYPNVSLPINYVIREEQLAKVRSALLADSAKIALTSGVKNKLTALHGMGGIGKSVMARALCDDKQVQAAFPHGILWTTLGQDPDLKEKLRDWIHALNGTIKENAPSLNILKDILFQLLSHRACLLIIDDVWQREHAKTFLAGGTYCRVLITTRNAELAYELGATIQPVPTMTMDEAITLLDEWANQSLINANRDIKEKIVNRLGCLPLAVKLAGAQLRYKSPDKWLETFDVRKLKSKCPEDIHDSLEQTFNLSLETLGKNERCLYASLSIFKEDEATPEIAVTRLWDALREDKKEETRELISDLESRALLEVQIAKTRTIRLHDLFRDLMFKELGDKKRNEAHQSLINAYRMSWKGTGWHTIEDDGYLYDHLVYHLRAIGSIDEIKGLFANQSWFDVRISQQMYEYDGYLSDLMVCWKMADKEAKDQIEENQTPIALIDCVRYALIRCSINSLAGNYTPELVSRALELELWKSSRAISIAEKISDDEKKAKLCSAILKTNKLTKEQHDKVKKIALDAALAIEDERDHVNALSALAPQLTGKLLQQALDAALTIEDEWQRAKALSALAPQLTGEQKQHVINQAFDAALAIEYKEDRADALSAIAPQLTGKLLQQALDAALAIEDEEDRAHALSALAPQLTGKLLQQVLDTALAIEFKEVREEVLSAIAPQLTGKLLQQALDAALAIKDEFLHVCVLSFLAPQLTGKQKQHVLKQVLNTAIAIKDDYLRPYALPVVAPHLTGKLLQQALDAALAIEDEGTRAKVLSAITAQLTGKQKQHVLKQTLDAALAIEDEGNRAEALSALAPQLTGKLLQQALDAALAIEDEGTRAEALSALAPQLTGKLLQQALDAALAIEDEADRADALSAIAPQLTGKLLQQALDATLAIEYEWLRAKALSAITPQLTGKQKQHALKQALDAALAIEDEADRADALSAIAPQLTGKQKQHALKQTLDAALAIEDEEDRADALSAIAPQLTGKLLQQALDAALAIEDEGNRAEALSALAPQLTGKLLQQALDATLAIEYEWQRAKVLSAITAQLTGKQKQHVLKQTLDAALAIEDEGNRAEALSALAPQLTGELFLQGLDSALAIKDVETCAELLVTFLSHVPEKNRLLKPVREIIVGCLMNFQDKECEELLHFFPMKGLFMPPFFDSKIIGKIAENVLEICWEWHWL